MKSLYKDSVKSQKTNTVYANSLIRGHEVSLFAEEEMHVIERLTANVGLRATTFHVQGRLISLCNLVYPPVICWRVIYRQNCRIRK